MAFDYYPVIDGQVSVEAKPVVTPNGKDHDSGETVTNGTEEKKEETVPRFVKSSRITDFGSPSPRKSKNVGEGRIPLRHLSPKTETFVRRELRAQKVGFSPKAHSLWGGKPTWEGKQIHLYPKRRLWTLFFWIPHWAMIKPREFLTVLRFFSGARPARTCKISMKPFWVWGLP